MNKPLAHRAICYDDEGRLDCSCRCRIGEAEREAEQMSRAEADQLVAEYQIKATAAVLDGITTNKVFFRRDFNELSRDDRGYAEDAQAERNRGY